MIFLKRLVEKKKPLRPPDQNPFQVRSNINTKYVVLSGQQKGMVTAVGQFKNSRFLSTPDRYDESGIIYSIWSGWLIQTGLAGLIRHFFKGILMFNSIP